MSKNHWETQPRVPKGNKGGGRFYFKKGYSSTTGIIQRITQILGRWKLPDEQLPRSVGAKWRNENITLLDGTIGHFLEGSKLQDRKIFAGKGVRRKIDDIDRLVRENPGTLPQEWMKAKAIAEVVFPDGVIVKVEVHWYEHEKIGKIEFKECNYDRNRK